MNDATSSSLHELNRISAELGNDFLLIQGAGGNTSVKDGDTLWVKASGKWLMHAETQPLFVPVRLEGVRQRIADDEADPVSAEVRSELNSAGLRPSIETTLHALMPQPAVLHAHSVETIAWAVREDGRARLAERLAGLRWAWVPYVRPGLPLTREVAKALLAAKASAQAGDAPVDVVVFGNHGLVIGADTPAEALALMRSVIARLVEPKRTHATPNIELLASAANGTHYRLPSEPACHALGTDPIATRIAAGGAMYPDHVVFLGGGLTVIDPKDGDVGTQLRSLNDPPAVIVAGAGVLVHDGLNAAGEAMLQCLAEVATRVDADARLSYLPDDEVAGLQQWDAEKYRQQLAQ